MNPWRDEWTSPLGARHVVGRSMGDASMFAGRPLISRGKLPTLAEAVCQDPSGRISIIGQATISPAERGHQRHGAITSSNSTTSNEHPKSEAECRAAQVLQRPWLPHHPQSPRRIHHSRPPTRNKNHALLLPHLRPPHDQILHRRLQQRSRRRHLLPHLRRPNPFLLRRRRLLPLQRLTTQTQTPRHQQNRTLSP